MWKLIVVALAVLVAGSAAAQVQVQGHYRSNGTYVAPYTRSSPDSSVYNNRSYQAPHYGAPSYSASRPLYTAPPASLAPRTNMVSGYVRRDGTYVAPYMRSSPRY